VGSIQSFFQNERSKSVLGIILTFSIIHFIEAPSIVLLILLPLWFLLFRPWNRTDMLVFLIASVFFLGQNYAVLSTGGFSFKHKDILLMPYYEPFLWGFYFLFLKRFIAEPSSPLKLRGKAVAGLILTALCFSIFSKNSSILLGATLVSTAILFVLFHEKYDLYYALAALLLGFMIEVFGVSTELWAYPDPDFLGIPYWFATMWISVGLLGRRFLIPLAELLKEKLTS
jgi:hypothetical protein